jgi:hypothetical protein
VKGADLVQVGQAKRDKTDALGFYVLRRYVRLPSTSHSKDA